MNTLNHHAGRCHAASLSLSCSCAGKIIPNLNSKHTLALDCVGCCKAELVLSHNLIIESNPEIIIDPGFACVKSEHVRESAGRYFCEPTGLSKMLQQLRFLLNLTPAI